MASDISQPELPALPSDTAIDAQALADARFDGADELTRKASELLVQGLSLKEVAAALGLRAVDLFRLGDSEQLRMAIRAGHLRRKELLAEQLEETAGAAVDELLSLIKNAEVSPGVKVQAINLALDFCGITPKDSRSSSGVGAGVEIEFDDRLRVLRARAAGRG